MKTMRKADLTHNHVPFDSAVSRYRAFMDKVIRAVRVLGDDQDKRDLAESILLRLTANWESFIDEHLVDCVNKDSTLLDTFFGVQIPKNPSKDLCHALIFGERYRDFRNFAEILSLSKRLLADESNPFKAVSKAHHKIDEVYTIRNYLSHLSSVSKRSLMKMYKDKYDMTNFIEPGKFLLAYDAAKLWAYFAAFEGASTDMKNWCASH
jgi:hypothetical protein